MSDAAFLGAMVTVEQAWLDGVVDAGIAPPDARANLADHLADGDAEAIARGADADGNPVTGMVATLRERTPAPTARWLHRGLTSQDVIDTALMLCARDALIRIEDQFATQVQALAGLAERHRSTPALARTLTQAALPSTLGVKFAHWLTGVLDAAEPLPSLRASLPVQAGGAVGTLAAATELAGSVDGAIALSDALAATLGLAPAPPWHTTRSTVTRLADALVSCCDAWGHIAADVATGSRPEIGEFAEGSGGGSSTMPHKNNPVRSVLIRRAALTAAPLGATLHTAAAASVDERSDGAWHAEWGTLRTLARRSVVAAAQTAELLTGLQVDAARAAANLAAAEGLLSEQKSMTELTGRPALPDYTGAADRLVDATLGRARRFIKDAP
jgi:3-carboxy-cis,cis-muconate cycloisomerase